MKNWCVYIVECADGSLYTGTSINVSKRLLMHNLGKGAKYTKGRGPVVLQYIEKASSRSEALVREHEIKSFTKEEKLKLIALSL